MKIAHIKYVILSKAKLQERNILFHAIYLDHKSIDNRTKK